jgi:hypothetical protein
VKTLAYLILVIAKKKFERRKPMDLDQFAIRSKGKSAEHLLQDEDFTKSIRSRTVFSTGLATQVLFNRPYHDERNAQFALNHKKSWANFIYYLANWEESNVTLTLPRPDHVLITSWHFPEVATLFSYAKKIHALLLVSQEAPWLEPLKAAECTLNLSVPGVARQLALQMRTGRIIATMLDHAHPDTHCEKVELLGRKVETPAGIFEICSRLGYLMVFVAPRRGHIEVVAQMDTTGKSAHELAQQYNRWLEVEVRRAPESWMMWQALPPR